MNNIIVLILVSFGIILTLNVFAVLILLKRTKGNNASDVGFTDRIKDMVDIVRSDMHELSRVLDSRLGETNRVVHDSLKSQFGESKLLVQQITRELTEVKETGKQVVGFAEQLKSLQDILKNPKQRGVLGEYYLESVLKNVLPPEHYKMQHRFKDNEIVDAVIYLDKGKILPIDSKFSLENYNRILEETDEGERTRYELLFKQDLKSRIDETAKYIRPNEGTMDFAFMFIPSEGIYYDLLINQVGAVKTSARDLIEYAFQKKKVIIVSPTSFLAYLQTVLQGLRSLQIEESAISIIKNVGELGRHLENYHTYHIKLGNAFSTAVNHYNVATKEFKKIDKDILRITGNAIEKEEYVELDKPNLEE